MLYSDNPARIWSPGTFQIMNGASYTIGADFVHSAIASLLQRTEGDIAADIESFGLGLNARRLKCVTFSDDKHAVICDPRDPRQAELIRDTFAQASKIVFHNSAFDIPNLYMNSLIRLEDIDKIWDTLIWARLADPGEMVPKNLEDACVRYLKIPKMGALVKAFKALGMSRTDGYFKFDLDRPVYIQGAAFDPLMTYRLRPIVRQDAYRRITSGHPFWKKGVEGQEAWRLVDREQRINQILLKRACKGYRVDFEYLEKYKDEHGAEMHRQEKELEELKIRPGVGPDLIKYLIEQNELAPNHPKTDPTPRAPEGNYKSDQKTLNNIGHPVVKLFQRQKETAKVQNDYLQKVVELADDDGRIHPNTNILSATTGRSSMGDPPIHQFPPKARGIILFDEGDPGCSIDWSQIEPITFANCAKDAGFVKDYENGLDTYCIIGVKSGMMPPGTTVDMCNRRVNLELYKKRSILKVVVLAKLYQEGLKKLTADLSLPPGPYHEATDWERDKLGVAPGTMMPSYAAARELQACVDTAMPRTADLIKTLRKIGTEHRKTITISGRVLDIPSGYFHGEWSVQSHKPPNYFCQGSAYDVLAETIVAVDEAGLSDALYFGMHDELIVSQSAANDIRKIMETAPERLCFWAGRTPILRTDRDNFDDVKGLRWQAA